MISEFKDFAQIAFWLTALFLSYLAYRNANKTLLSPVNTEYQKRVFDNLLVLNDALFSDLKYGNERYRAYKIQTENIWSQIKLIYNEDKSFVEKIGIDISDIEIKGEFLCFKKLSDEVRYNAFIPKKIRDNVVEHLDNVANVSFDSTLSAIVRLLKDIDDKINSEGILPKNFFEDEFNIDLENYYLESMSEQGLSYEEIESKSIIIMNDIIKYIESFNPIKK